MAAPIITLTTDFGLSEPYVGIMKGVILGICPGVRLVDLAHDIGPQDVLQAGLVLESSVRFFPAGTIHLAVVDPGVGSARRGLGLRVRSQYFVGPDNGLFTFALGGDTWTAVSLEAPEYRLTEVSRTFHGRDIFAPAAAHLAAGVPLERMGPAAGDLVRLEWPRGRREGDEIVGEVIGSDRFGNLLTSVTAEQIDSLALTAGVAVTVGDRDLGGLASSYADRRAGVPAAIIGSAGRLEIFARNASARVLIGADRGTPIRVRRR